jgi:protein kinase C substrate 80K-H
VDLVCGIDNALLAISEPEKCEYRVTGTTPTLCIVDKASGDAGTYKKDERPKDEL